MELYKIVLSKTYPHAHMSRRVREIDEHVVFIALHPTDEHAQKEAIELMLDYNVEQLSQASQDKLSDRIELALNNSLNDGAPPTLLDDIEDMLDIEMEHHDINSEDNPYYMYNVESVLCIKELHYADSIYVISINKKEE